MGTHKRQRLAAIAGVGLLLITAVFLQACGDSPVLTMMANLDATQEVPANVSPATAQVVIKLDQKGDSLSYTLSVQNIRNVVQAHLHSPGTTGVNAGVVLFLFGPVAVAGGPASGEIASGTKTSADLVGSLAGHPLQDLINSIKAGIVYANVHTSDGTKTSGPGNLPGGEIRAQVVVQP